MKKTKLAPGDEGYDPYDFDQQEDEVAPGNFTFVPLRKYLFKVNNKDSRRMSSDVILISLMLTLKRYLPSG